MDHYQEKNNWLIRENYMFHDISSQRVQALVRFDSAMTLQVSPR